MLRMQVNGENLAGIVGGEVAHANFHSSRGEPYVIILEFTKPKERKPSGTSDHCQDVYKLGSSCYFLALHIPQVLNSIAEFMMVLVFSEHAGAGVDRANARITCHYFPIIQV